MMSGNREVVDFNVDNNFIAPYMPRKIYTRRCGVYAFRDQFLTDGFYQDKSVINNWRREIKHVDFEN